MKLSRLLVAALVFGLMAAAAGAQTWPDKPVRIIVPLTAGSATDVMARTVAQQLSEQLGQPFIVENKPGAAGTIGVGTVARAKPDGYTLLVQSSSYTITPITYPNTPYDTLRDLAGVTPLALLPQALVVSPAKGIASLPDLIAAAKAKPGVLNYGSAGIGTANQLNAERFRVGAGIDAVHVPFKGTPEVVTELLAGRIDYFFCPINVCLPDPPEARAGARHGQLPALGGLARAAYHARARRAGVGPQFLGRPVRAGRDAARHCRQALPRDRTGARQPGGEAEPGRPGGRAESAARFGRKSPQMPLW
jgi:tripartite-type tricarboxylate transporter receptor subunit TctC